MRLAARLRRMVVSHVGGDDFLIVCDVEEIGTVAGTLLGLAFGQIAKRVLTPSTGESQG